VTDQPDLAGIHFDQRADGKEANHIHKRLHEDGVEEDTAVLEQDPDGLIGRCAGTVIDAGGRDGLIGVCKETIWEIRCR